MNVFFITLRSVTQAQRGERILKKANLSCVLQRTPRWMEEQGCGYCLKLRGEDVEKAVQLLRSGGIPFRKVYLHRGDGTVGEVEI